MIVFGITGGIGSGKSVVSRLMQMIDIPVYIADERSKQLLDTSDELKQKLTDAFGNQLYRNGKIDKALFASIIFSDKEKLQLANNLIHPEVQKDFMHWLDSHRRKKTVIAATESAILFESGFNRFVDKVILVYTPREIRIQRAMARDQASMKQIEARLNAQQSDEDKIRLADIMITNDGSHSLISQVNALINKYLKHS